MAGSTVMGIPEERVMFTDLWNLYKKYYKPVDTDDYWCQLVNDLTDVYDTYQTKMCQEFCSMIANELDRRFRFNGI